MQDTPDLSKIISIIMQNPTLISEIAALASSSGSKAEVKEEETAETVTDPVVSEAEIAPQDEPPRTRGKAHRRELLNAMKPYLSEQRRGALDSMSSILDIIDVMARKES